MADPDRPIAWANFLAGVWGRRFPVDVRTIALEYSTRYPDPIKTVRPADIESFEGALCPLAKSGKWAILYNPAISSPGRINFTLAHELGHYLCHRGRSPGGFECGEAGLLGLAGNEPLRLIEQEADAFASYLLMPIDDYREQVGRNAMSLDLLNHSADRYGVSRTAAAIKWLDFTPECAALVVATNGFVLWGWRSRNAKRRRIFYDKGMALPPASVAAQPARMLGEAGVLHPPGVWHPRSEVREMAIFADNYEMTISLLIFGDEDWRAGFEDS